MSVIIRANVALKPGARLLYDCPLRGGSFEADRYFESHRRKYATFIGYAETHVGPLDHNGRLPGRYIKPKSIRVQFAGEEIIELQVMHFIVDANDCCELQKGLGESDRLGDLPYTIQFYHKDFVVFKNEPTIEGLTNEPRQIRVESCGMTHERDGGGSYRVSETEAETRERIRKLGEQNPEALIWGSSSRLVRTWSVPSSELVLIARGAIWILYHDPANLSFASDKIEAEFWALNGISKVVYAHTLESASTREGTTKSVFGLSLEDAYQLFTEGHADIITPAQCNPGKKPRFDVRQLHACFTEQRGRVRLLTERLYGPQSEQSAA